MVFSPLAGVPVAVLLPIEAADIKRQNQVARTAHPSLSAGACQPVTAPTNHIVGSEGVKRGTITSPE